jgi:hypothetical protein
LTSIPYFTTLPREVLEPLVVLELLLLLLVLRLVLLLVLRLVVLEPLLLLLVVVVVPNNMSHDEKAVATPRSNIAAKIHFFMIRIVLYWFIN